MNNEIKVFKAKENNLKSVDLTLPKEKLVVFTGVSGSGKSSLAFDTIFAEGQRRYVESLSVYARQFLGQLDKPDVERIDGLSPAISIDQKSTSSNPRSTVGTVTEIYDYLRLLFARVGEAFCPNCGKKVKAQSIDEIVDKIMQFDEGTRIQIISPVVKGKKGEFQNTIKNLQDEGFIRLKIDGKVVLTDEEEINLAKTKKHDISIVIDRVIVKESSKSRIAESVEIALKKSNGTVVVEDVSKNEEIMFSEKFSCPDCNLSFDEITPKIFSFNSPYGACEECNGIGAHFQINPDLIVPDKKKSISEGAIFPWAKTQNQYYSDILKSVCSHFDIDMDLAFEKLPQSHQDIILYGSGKEKILFIYKNFLHEGYIKRNMPFLGVVNYFMKKYEETNSEEVKSEIQKYMTLIPCKTCNGARLKPFPLSIRINGKNIFELTSMPIDEAFDFVSELFLSLSDYHLQIVKQLLEEIRNRLKFLIDVGLNYLSLDRMSLTLSGGESQRIRLATQIGSALSGVLYVLDEPSIGLHQRDNDRLIQTLINLRNLGNTLIVVEHDEDTILKADHIVDIGPYAGVYGGEIVAQGSVDDIKKNPKSLTGQYLSGKLKIPFNKMPRNGNGNFLKVKNAHLNNLKNIDLDIPLGKIVAITGVSGSGKSTLMQDLIFEFACHKLRKNKPKPQGIDDIEGFENVDKIIDIDQSPIGRTPRSNPATYTDVFTAIRDLFSKTEEAKIRGYKAGRFSFNVKGGRCEACKGDGVNKIEMNFLSDVYVKCPVCNGKRYNSETLEVKYKGKDISDVLNMDVKEALAFFENIPSIKSKLQTLYEVGLGYIKLGQSSTTLSGGEAQRIKLASELNKKSNGKTLYLLDEPSVGLHWFDLEKLICILNKLADNGNTILLIEHNLDLIKISDFVVDLGPEGGNKGGEVVGLGSVFEIMENEKSYTGQYLKKLYARQKQAD